MRAVLKWLGNRLFVPAVKWYLRKDRDYHFGDIRLRVFSGVFHPGFFYSTKFLIRFLEPLDLKRKSFLELGCGTGLLSVIAAKRGANVTASDIVLRAVENTALNAKLNNVQITTTHSDLFDNLSRRFDLVVINPPYYEGEPPDDEQRAWYCGAEHEYFRKLAQQLPDHLNDHGEAFMVLTKGCNVNVIMNILTGQKITVEKVAESKVLFDERDFVFRLRYKSARTPSLSEQTQR